MNRVVPLLTPLVLAACAPDLLMTPDVTQAARLSGAAASVRSGDLIPARVKYRENGARPARGRSGSATLEVRALRGLDGVTTLEATTGSLEDGTQPGQISKVQVKLSGADGLERTWNDNAPRATGYWSQQLADSESAQAVQVQANIRGIDPRRTGVVTVSTPIYRRPDLAVGQVVVVESVEPGAPVPILGVVNELNGDVGARGDCVLLVDDAEVVRLPGIWVDAGDAVTCYFTHAFESEGEHTVAVLVSEVNPGDWRDDNNRAEATVSVAAGQRVPNRGSMTFEQRTIEKTRLAEPTWADPAETPFRSAFWETETNIAATSVGFFDAPIALPMQHVEGSLTANGASFGAVSVTAQGTIQSIPGVFQCWMYMRSGATFSACSVDAGGRNSGSVAFSRSAGGVTYGVWAQAQYSGEWEVLYSFNWVWSEPEFEWPTLAAGMSVGLVADFVTADGETIRLAPSATLEDWGARTLAWLRQSYVDINGTVHTQTEQTVQRTLGARNDWGWED